MKKRLMPLMVCAALGFGTTVATANAPLLPPLFGGGGGSAPAKSTDPAPPRRAVLMALRLEQYAPVDSAAAPVANLPPPTVLAAPRVSTLDRNTATVAVTGAPVSYAISLSPVVETVRATEAQNGVTAGDYVQTDWNVRLTGKGLPAGNTAVTLTGATRLVVGKESVLAEISLRDAESGKTTLYRLWATPTLPAQSEPSKP